MIDHIKDVAIAAGKQILAIYNDDKLSAQIEHKSDDSPLTLADKTSNEVIVAALKKYYPEIPILSEEGKTIDYKDRKDWNKFWLVDPLDGTKEFIKKNGEFTVNIALIENGYPVLGVIYAPVLNKLYVGDSINDSAYIIDEKSIKNPLKVNNKAAARIAVGSRSHSSVEEQTLLKSYDVMETISIGSSLKFCMVAEGKADMYYRHGPTMEWDTAAGQAIVEAAGGKVTHKKSGERFRYNRENLLNESFLVLGF